MTAAARRVRPNATKASVEAQVKAINEQSKLAHVRADFGLEHDWPTIAVALDRFEEELGGGFPLDESALRAIGAMLPDGVELASDPEGHYWLITDDPIAGRILASEDGKESVREWLTGTGGKMDLDSVFSTKSWREIDLNDVGQLHWEALEHAQAADREDIRAHPENYLYLPRELAFGDYDGSTAVERSNFRVFMEEYGETRDAFGEQGIYEIYGGHGAQAVGIRLSVANVAVLETLSALASYPLISQDDMGALEIEMMEEAWNNYGRADFIDAVEKKFGIEIEETDGIDALWAEIDRGGNPLWEIEGGGGVHFRIDAAVKELERTDLDAAGIEYTKDDDDEG